MRLTWRPGPTALAALITLLNAAKPAAVDDTAYLLFARHVAAHPLDPYGFELFWYRQPEPAMHVLLPPVVPYWLALGIALFGEHLVLLKLWLFPFALAFAHSVWFLLRRFARGTEAQGTLLTACSAFVLPLFGVMLDVPAIALGLAAVALFVRGCDGRRAVSGAMPTALRGHVLGDPHAHAKPWAWHPRSEWAFIFAAGLVTGLAAQTKYTMIAAPVVLVWYGLLHRRLAMAVGACAVAVGAFAAWECWLTQQYGESHFLFHVRDQDAAPPQVGLSEKLSELLQAKIGLVQPMFGYVGGLGLVWGLFAARALGVGSRFVLAVGIVAVVGILAVCALPYSDTVLLKNHTTGSVRLDLPALVFYPLGTGVMLTAAAAVIVLVVRKSGRLRRYPDAWFVAGWFAIELAAYFVLTPFPAGRRVIGLCVVIGVVVCRLVSRVVRVQPSRRPGRWIAAFGVTLGLGTFALDAWDALAERDLVEQSARVVGDSGKQHVWTQGHWGWQYYADRRGWELIEPGRSQLRTGDWLVQPVVPDERGFYRPYHGGALFVLDPAAVELVAEFVWDDAIAGQTIPNLYGGTVPVIGRDHARLRVVVYRVTRDWTPQRR